MSCAAITPPSIEAEIASSLRSAVVRVGCPPKRRIRVRFDARGEDAGGYRYKEWNQGCQKFGSNSTRAKGPWTDGCYCNLYKPGGASSTYTYESISAVDSTVSTVAATYDYERYGCPRRHFHEEAWKPVIELLDGDEVVKLVDSNFIVIELQGRQDDFVYNLTASAAGCVQKSSR